MSRKKSSGNDRDRLSERIAKMSQAQIARLLKKYEIDARPTIARVKEMVAHHRGLHHEVIAAILRGFAAVCPTFSGRTTFLHACT